MCVCGCFPCRDFYIKPLNDCLYLRERLWLHGFTALVLDILTVCLIFALCWLTGTGLRLLVLSNGGEWPFGPSASWVEIVFVWPFCGGAIVLGIAGLFILLWENRYYCSCEKLTSPV
jgi:hypothetical protein